MNASSVAVPYGTDEFSIAGLTPVMAQLVDAPYVGEAVAALECRVTKVLTLPDMDGNETDSHAVFGQVVGIHIADGVIRDGRFDLAFADPIMRLGYMDYAGIGPVFERAQLRDAREHGLAALLRLLALRVEARLKHGACS